MQYDDSDDTIIQLGQVQVRYLVDGSHSRQPGMYEMTLPPGCIPPPPHCHRESDELLYVLEGRLRHVAGGVVRDLGAGETIFTRRGTMHGVTNPFAGVARCLTVLTPDVGAAFFFAAAELMNADVPPDRARLMAMMARQGPVPSRTPVFA